RRGPSCPGAKARPGPGTSADGRGTGFFSPTAELDRGPRFLAKPAGRARGTAASGVRCAGPVATRPARRHSVTRFTGNADSHHRRAVKPKRESRGRPAGARPAQTSRIFAGVGHECYDLVPRGK